MTVYNLGENEASGTPVLPLSLRPLGALHAYVGPMCSGKSREVILQLLALQGAGHHCVAFRPSQDTRDDELCLVSRVGCSFPAKRITDAQEAWAYVQEHKEINVVAFDEPHMMGESFIQVMLDLRYAGYNVLVAGLNLDFRGQPMAPMTELLCFADKVITLYATCGHCGADALYSFRNSESKELIEPGGADKYTPVCPQCWRRLHKQK